MSQTTLSSPTRASLDPIFARERSPSLVRPKPSAAWGGRCFESHRHAEQCQDFSGESEARFGARREGVSVGGRLPGED